MLINDFNIWHQGFDGGTVWIYLAGTTTPAPIFLDPACTVPATPNPQILTSEERNGEMGGKFAAVLYADVAIECRYSSTDETGVQTPPITDLAGEDVSASIVTATGGSVSHDLASIVARTVYALDFGALGASAATNTATLNAAIGVAAGLGGGEVIIPAGAYPFTQLTLGQGVELVGQGRDVTILQSQTADKCLTLTGDRAGFKRLTLDGVNNGAGGIGVYAKAADELLFQDALITNFETGVYFQGARRLRWHDVYVDACGRGVRWVGDSDASHGANGDQFSDAQWIGGRVTNCTVSGVELEYEDRPCIGNSILGVGFEDNTGTAFKIQGAQITRLDGCWWEGNTADINVNDDTTSTANDDNVVDGLVIANGRINAGTVTFAGTALNVMLDRLDLAAVAVTLTVPTNPVLVRDCIEDALVTIAGTGTKWLRNRSIDRGASFGITTDATVTKAWEVALDEGQVVLAVGAVIGNQQNGTNTGEYYIAVSAKRAGATLAYDAQTVNFTVGAIVTGVVSGCKARIIGDSDSGTTGTLTVRDIVPGTGGRFIDNEAITDTSGGAATANGTLSVPTVSLLGSVTSLRAAREDVSAWDAAFVANGPALELRVTGAASTTIEWTPAVSVTLS